MQKLNGFYSKYSGEDQRDLSILSHFSSSNVLGQRGGAPWTRHRVTGLKQSDTDNNSDLWSV